jgi:hypothetical protein
MSKAPWRWPPCSSKRRPKRATTAQWSIQMSRNAAPLSLWSPELYGHNDVCSPSRPVVNNILQGTVRTRILETYTEKLSLCLMN